MDSDEIYREKYLKYKKKYNDLKKVDQEGGLNFFKKMVSGPATKANIKFQEETIKLLKKYSEEFAKTEFPKLTEGMTPDSKSSTKDVAAVFSSFKNLTGYKFAVSTGLIEARINTSSYYIDEKNDSGKNEAKASKLRSGEKTYGDIDYKKELFKSINDVVNGRDINGKKKGKEFFEGKIINIEGSEGLVEQENFNTWAKTIVEYEQDKIIEKLEVAEGYQQAKSQGTAGSLETYNNLSKGAKITLLRQKEIAMKDCHKEGLPKTWLACTGPKLDSFKYVKKNIPEITSEKEKLETVLKSIPKKAEDGGKEYGDFTVEIDALNAAVDALYDKRVEAVKTRLGLEFTKEEFLESSIKQKIISAPLDYDPIANTEEPVEVTEEPEVEQEGGFLPEFLTETPRF